MSPCDEKHLKELGESDARTAGHGGVGRYREYSE